MADYIDREALLDDLKDSLVFTCRTKNIPSVEMRGARKVIDRIEAAKAIEIEPVRHGKWKWDGKHFYCSNCAGTRYHDLVLGLDAAYCPFCGAKMGKED